MTDAVLFNSATVSNALTQMTKAISASEVCLIGIHSGGAKVADAIQSQLEAMGNTVQRGNLDISFYRDDLDTIGPNPEVRPSELPFDVSGKDIWLIDDVLYSGRTIRAAMGELFDYGRPASIRLAVLVDRGGRQLPIQADCVGLQHTAAPANCTVELITDGQITDKLITGETWYFEQRQVK
ncbi:MAG: bifunctional pyr operon transcriptional regulator/uracil phosphoribosyltransferase PyrR [Mariprofundus sp.]|nr:bifunctional pyr operon transcriptional regulator/uracil phosphoribosyltransferase PyrR [Mariprofundus sp.]